MGTAPGIGVIVLAAGASRRLGAPKQLLMYRGRSLLRHAVDVALASDCRPVVVVLGAHAERLLPEVAALPVHVVTSQEWAEGMSASLRAGIHALTALPDPPEAVVLLTCDQPLIEGRTIRALVEAYRSARKPIVACEYAGTLGVPALFTRDLFQDLMALEGDHGARHLIRRCEHAVVRFPLPEAAIDIDTQADYETLGANLRSP